MEATQFARRKLSELATALDAVPNAGPPWLSAATDQHAAQIRDALAGPDGRIPVLRLAAYADGVLDTAERRGWILDSAVHWATEAGAELSWPLLRLLAICSLAPFTT